MNFLSRALADFLMRRLTGTRRLEGRAAGALTQLDPRRFGIAVEDPRCRGRIQAILGAFFAGFEGTLKGTAVASGQVEPLLRPFHSEGAAMGCLPNGYLRFIGTRCSLRRFEEVLCRPDDPFLLLRYVGLGFWLGFRHRSAKGMERVASALEGRRYRHLVHDGYGFKLGFFDLPRRRPAGPPGERDEELWLKLRLMQMEGRLSCLRGFGQLSAWNGLGRGLWFHYMDRVEVPLTAAARFGAAGEAIAGGLGLAAAFTFPDDLPRAYGIGDRLQGEQQRHFRKGLRIALYVRAMNDGEYLRSCLDSLETARREAARRDLEHALKVGEATHGRDDFIEAFHRGCLNV